MTLASGTRLGPYQITASIGAGGMGEVYQARDTRLGRDVAVKVLPPEVARDADRVWRFEEEARAAAALNHSNILAVYDIGSDLQLTGGAPTDSRAATRVSYVVTELLEGRTLRRVLEDERLSVPRVVELATQIADGLAAAHSRGIVHRDLKPENVFVVVDGRAKILDFGLAKLMEPAGGGAAVEGPTRANTAPNVVLGTVGYMAPEQLRGEAVDHRADIFAFGVVVYEMLMGRRAFAGTSVIDAATAILREPPAPMVSTMDRPLPPALVRLVERCLEKSPPARFQSTTDLAFALRSLSQADSTAAGPVPPTVAPEGPARGRNLLPWTAAAVFALAAIAQWHPWAERPAPLPLPVVRSTFAPPDGIDFDWAGVGVSPFPAISPDGQQVVFSAGKPGEPGGLWLRKLKDLGSRLIDGTAKSRATMAFWSPDGRSIGFFADNKLKRVGLDGGVVETLCDAPDRSAGAWGADGTIIFGGAETDQTAGGPLKRVPAGGGPPSALTTLNAARKETGHQQPSFLPDGRHFLYRSMPEGAIWVGSLDGSAPVRLMPSDSRAVYAPPGYLLFVRRNTLFAQRFDANRLALAGEPSPVAENMRTNATNGHAAFAVSSTGVLVYRAGQLRELRTLTWYDRTTRQRTGVVKDSAALYDGLSFLPREQAIVAHVLDQANGGSDLWRIDLQTGARVRLTTDPGDDDFPVVSPDGESVAWASNRTSPPQIFRKPSSGAGADEPWIKLDTAALPSQWSAHWLVFTAHSTTWAAPVAEPAKARAYLQTGAVDINGQLSPDERWMAYDSGETGKRQVYVRPFPDANAGKWTVSGTEGGDNPKWRGDGRELFYLSPGGRLMAVTITPRDRAIASSQPQELFQEPGLTYAHVAVTRDGQRFLVASLPQSASMVPLTVVVNWPGLIAPTSAAK